MNIRMIAAQVLMECAEDSNLSLSIACKRALVREQLSDKQREEFFKELDSLLDDQVKDMFKDN